MEDATRRLSILSSHFSSLSHGSIPIRLLPLSTYNSTSASGDQGESILQNDCIFCKIIRGESPSFKLYEDDICLCILDRNPLSYGHSLIIPKSHFCSLQETPPTIVAAMCSKVPFISNAIMKATGSVGADSFNLLVNNGAAAGQVIFHTHIHIIPRKVHDCLWASESLRRHSLKLDGDACRLANRVREQLLSDKAKESEDEGSSLIGN